MRTYVTSNEQAFLEAVEKYGARVVTQAAPRAVNATLRNLRVELSRSIRQVLPLRKDVIEGTKEDGSRRKGQIIRTTSASRGSRGGRPEVSEATLSVSFREVPIKHYPHSQTRRPLRKSRSARTGGTRVKLHRKQPRKLIRGAFIVPSKEGHVFAREGSPVLMKKGRYRGKRRQQITRLHGPSVIAIARPILDRLYESGWVRERLTANLDQEIRFILSRSGAAGATNSTRQPPGSE